MTRYERWLLELEAECLTEGVPFEELIDREYLWELFRDGFTPADVALGNFLFES
jgi:hypothetical protein